MNRLTAIDGIYDAGRQNTCLPVDIDFRSAAV